MALSPREALSAYQGKGWKPRKAGLSEELAGGRGIWSPWRVDSEYKRLEAVLLYCPGSELENAPRPNPIQHVARIGLPALKTELASLAAILRRLGVEVHAMPRTFRGPGWPDKHNLMYVRDLFFNTREGAVVSRMASAVRAGEEKFASAALSGLGVPINRTISGKALFEGADALWLDGRTVLCGVGNRTNAAGFRQLRDALAAQGVRTLPVALPRGVQHLMGILQIVDAGLALVRADIAPKSLVRLLARRRFAFVRVRETEEVVRQGMNIVTVAPRTILMPRDCPGLKRQYAKAGISIAAELDISQLARGAGGLGCATGILSRRT